MKILCLSNGPLSLELFHAVFLPSNRAHCTSVNGATAFPCQKTAASILMTGSSRRPFEVDMGRYPIINLGGMALGLGTMSVLTSSSYIVMILAPLSSTRRRLLVVVDPGSLISNLIYINGDLRQQSLYWARILDIKPNTSGTHPASR